MKESPVTPEKMAEMNITFNFMALELQQRRTVMSQQEAQIKELKRKVAIAESIIVELNQKLDTMNPVADNAKPGDPGEDLEEMNRFSFRDGINVIHHREPGDPGFEKVP